MIEIPLRKVLNLMDNEAFRTVINVLKSADKLTVVRKYSANVDLMTDKAQFRFADKKDELAFKIKFGDLILQ
jgi:hypothetical protein